jgi:signal peptidase II
VTPVFAAGGAGRWYLLALLVVVLDQVTKTMAVAALEYGRPVAITGFFNLTLLYNPGAAFSFLSDADGWQRWFFAIIALGVSAVLLVWIWRLPAQARLQRSALALILGGALGNLWDRLVLGHVVDFIQLHYDDWYWPAFNIADSAITVGAVLIVAEAFLTRKSNEVHD